MTVIVGNYKTLSSDERADLIGKSPEEIAEHLETRAQNPKTAILEETLKNGLRSKRKRISNRPSRRIFAKSERP